MADIFKVLKRKYYADQFKWANDCVSPRKTLTLVFYVQMREMKAILWCFSNLISFNFEFFLLFSKYS